MPARWRGRWSPRPGLRAETPGRWRSPRRRPPPRHLRGRVRHARRPKWSRLRPSGPGPVGSWRPTHCAANASSAACSPLTCCSSAPSALIARRDRRVKDEAGHLVRVPAGVGERHLCAVADAQKSKSGHVPGSAQPLDVLSGMRVVVCRIARCDGVGAVRGRGRRRSRRGWPPDRRRFRTGPGRAFPVGRRCRGSRLRPTGPCRDGRPPRSGGFSACRYRRASATPATEPTTADPSPS